MNVLLTNEKISNQRILQFYKAERELVKERDVIVSQLYNYMKESSYMNRFNFPENELFMIFDKIVRMLKDDYQVFRGFANLMDSNQTHRLLPSFRIIETNHPEMFLKHIDTYNHRNVTCQAGVLERIEQEEWMTLLHDEPIRIMNGEPISFADARFNPCGSYLLFGKTYEWIKKTGEYSNKKEGRMDIQQFSLMIYHPKQKKENRFYQSMDIKDKTKITNQKESLINRIKTTFLKNA